MTAKSPFPSHIIITSLVAVIRLSSPLPISHASNIQGVLCRARDPPDIIIKLFQISTLFLISSPSPLGNRSCVLLKHAHPCHPNMLRCCVQWLRLSCNSAKINQAQLSCASQEVWSYFVCIMPAHPLYPVFSPPTRCSSFSCWWVTTDIPSPVSTCLCIFSTHMSLASNNLASIFCSCRIYFRLSMFHPIKAYLSAVVDFPDCTPHCSCALKYQKLSHDLIYACLILP